MGPWFLSTHPQPEKPLQLCLGANAHPINDLHHPSIYVYVHCMYKMSFNLDRVQ